MKIILLAAALAAPFVAGEKPKNKFDPKNIHWEKW